MFWLMDADVVTKKCGSEDGGCTGKNVFMFNGAWYTLKSLVIRRKKFSVETRRDLPDIEPETDGDRKYCVLATEEVA